MIASALSLAVALAASDAAARTRMLPTVAVTARAGVAEPTLPGSRSVIDADTIRRSGPMVDASEVLVRVPGVVANNRYNYAQDLQLSVRGYGARAGFGVRGVRLYVNGIPATAPDGQGQLSNAALASAARIEVVRGPLAALYGNGGGAIKIDVEPGMSPPGGRALAFADGDLQRFGAALRGGDAAFGWNVDAGRFETDGFRPHSAARRDLVDAVAAWSLPQGWRLSTTVNVLDAPDAQDPLGLTPAEFERDPDSTTPVALAFDTRKSTRQAQFGAAIARDAGEARGAQLALYGGRRNVEQFLAVPLAAQVAPTSAGGVIDLERDYAGAELRIWQDLQPFGMPLRITAGFDADVLDERRRGYENFVGGMLGVRGRLRRDEDNRIERRDLLLQADWQPAPDWHAVAGVRRNVVEFESVDGFVAAGNPDDSGSRRFSANTPALGLRWSASPDWSLHAALARGFETPTANELAYSADGASGFNLALQPARSTMRELGLRHATGKLLVEAALFRDDTRDEIVVARAVGGRTSFRNGGEVRRRGLELALATDFGEQWSLNAAWTLLDARFVSGSPACAAAPCAPGAQAIVAGARLPAVPPRFGLIELRWTPDERWSAQLELRAAGGNFADDGNRLRADSYLAANLALRRTLAVGDDTLALIARIDNLGDRRHVGSVVVNDGNGRVFEPAPGRRLLLGAEWSW
jgi:iron complex outermembrane receptor protein